MTDPEDVNSCGGCAITCHECHDCYCYVNGECGPSYCPCMDRSLRRLFDGDDGLRAGDADEAFDVLSGIELENEECPRSCLGGCPACRPDLVVGNAAMARAYLGRG